MCACVCVCVCVCVCMCSELSLILPHPPPPPFFFAFFFFFHYFNDVMMADSTQMRIFGKVDGQFLHVGWWQRCGLRMIGMLLSLPASFVFPLQHHASLP